MTWQKVCFDQGDEAGCGRMSRFSAIELLLVLLLFIVVIPFLNILPYGELVQTVLLTLVLLSAVFVVAESRHMFLVAVVLAVPAFVGKWANYVRPDMVPATFFLVATLVFVTFVVFSLFRFIFKAPRVNVEVLSAAASNYLMIGLLWMFAYVLLSQLLPGSFALGGGPPPGAMDRFDALYFSFVTLCTVGYGDITPISRPARMLAILEATTGTFYITIVIARLVALYTSEGEIQGHR